jgi:hypothetical protein
MQDDQRVGTHIINGRHIGPTIKTWESRRPKGDPYRGRCRWAIAERACLAEIPLVTFPPIGTVTAMAIPIALDMETGDPDDVFTLCALATHPWARLVAVTVMPGSDEQVGIVKHLLGRLGVTVPVGAYRPGSDAKPVSGFHRRWLGKVPPREPDAEAWQLLQDTFATKDATLLTGHR